jgi:hypothetical protein
MKIIIGENTESKLSGLLQTKIGEILDDIKKRYRKEEIGASNWYLNAFSKIDKVVVRNLKVNPYFSIYIDVYSNHGHFDEDDAQSFAVYLKEELSYIGNPWVVPMLINNNLEDEDMISENENENEKPKLNDVIQSMIDESGLVNTIKSSGGYDTFVTIIPDYFKSKTKKIDLINDIIVYDEEAGGRIYLEDFMNPIVIREGIVDGETFQHEISFIENDIVCVAVWEYDEDGDQLDDMNDTYDMYLEEIQPRHLNQIFEGLINEYLR